MLSPQQATLFDLPTEQEVQRKEFVQAKPCKTPIAQREARKRYYQRNRGRFKEEAAAMREENHASLRDKARERMATFKAGMRCKICGETHPACLDFHHKGDDKKLFNICEAVSRGYSDSVIWAEIAKCEVLCANCHRKEHYQD